MSVITLQDELIKLRRSKQGLNNDDQYIIQGKVELALYEKGYTLGFLNRLDKDGVRWITSTMTLSELINVYKDAFNYINENYKKYEKRGALLWLLITLH